MALLKKKQKFDLHNLSGHYPTEDKAKFDQILYGYSKLHFCKLI